MRSAEEFAHELDEMCTETDGHLVFIPVIEADRREVRLALFKEIEALCNYDGCGHKETAIAYYKVRNKYFPHVPSEHEETRKELEAPNG